MGEKPQQINNELSLRQGTSVVEYHNSEIFTQMAVDAIPFAEVVASRDDSEAQPAFEKGQAFLDAGDIPAAIDCFLLAAELGHLLSQLRLGGIFLEGLGGRLDYDAAKVWFERAAQQGEDRAYLKLGWMHEAGLGVEANNKRSVYYYRISAESGNAEAQFNIGVKYDNAEGVEHNPEEAVRWFLMAAEQGYADARYFLGQALEAGEGVDQNIPEAIDWYFLAAEQGHASARRRFWSHCISGNFKPESYEDALFAETCGLKLGQQEALYPEALGILPGSEHDIYPMIIKCISGDADEKFEFACLYENGEFVAKNETAAAYWYHRAAEKNHAGALNNLGVIYSNSKLGYFDKNKSTDFFRRSAEFDSKVGMFNFGNCLVSGDGVRKNVRRGIKMLEESAMAGYGNAMSTLADMYYSGKVVEEDYSAAKFWYERACDSEVAAGFFGLGHLYGFGLGVEMDLAKALSYFESAIDRKPKFASRLADYYEKGIIFDKDEKLAEKWRLVFENAKAVKSDEADDDGEQYPSIGQQPSGRLDRLNEKRKKERRIKGIFD